MPTKKNLTIHENPKMNESPEFEFKNKVKHDFDTDAN